MTKAYSKTDQPWTVNVHEIKQKTTWPNSGNHKNKQL